MKAFLCVLTLAFAALGQQFGLRENNGVSLLVVKQGVGLPGVPSIPDAKPSIMVWVKTERTETTAFRVTVKYRESGITRTETKTFDRRPNLPYTPEIFSTGEAKFLSVVVEELRPHSSAEFE